MKSGYSRSSFVRAAQGPGQDVYRSKATFTSDPQSTELDYEQSASMVAPTNETGPFAVYRKTTIRLHIKNTPAGRRVVAVREVETPKWTEVPGGDGSTFLDGYSKTIEALSEEELKTITDQALNLATQPVRGPVIRESFEAAFGDQGGSGPRINVHHLDSMTVHYLRDASKRGQKQDPQFLSGSVQCTATSKFGDGRRPEKPHQETRNFGNRSPLVPGRSLPVPLACGAQEPVLFNVAIYSRNEAFFSEANRFSSVKEQLDSNRWCTPAPAASAAY